MAALVIISLFIGLPIAEILTFIEVGGHIGGLATIGATIATAFAGAFLFRYQGLATLARARESLDQGVMPLEAVLGGLGLLLAALCLFVPGFITDLVGFLLFIPPIRTIVMAILLRSLLTRGRFHVSSGGPGFHAGFGATDKSGDIIDGEYHDLGDPDIERPVVEDRRRDGAKRANDTDQDGGAMS